MAGRVLAGDGGLVLKMHDLGLLAANLDEKSILKRCNTGSVTVSASHTLAHTGISFVSYHLGLLLSFQLLVQLPQARRTVVWRLGGQHEWRGR